MSTMAPALPIGHQAQIPQGETGIAVCGVPCSTYNVADYPNPDLAIEVEISLSLIDRPAIYAALSVT